MNRNSPEYQEIFRSSYFDTNYYLSTYPDVKSSKMDPIMHYLNHGADEGRNPSRYFETSYYLAQNPDVAITGINPLLHYLRHGKFEGRKPSPIERIHKQNNRTSFLNKSATHYYLTICAIAKEESRYIDEWIAYHYIKGVDHIFLRYDPASSDIEATKNILEKWIRIGYLTVEWARTKGLQGNYYAKVARTIQSKTFWCAFIDLDEFLWTPDHINIRNYLKKFEENVDTIDLECIWFGSNNHLHYEDKLVTERFSGHRQTDKLTGDTSLKNIIRFNPFIKDLVMRIKKIDPHIIHGGDSFKRLHSNQSIQVVNGLPDYKREGQLHYIGIAHYWCKTYEEFIESKKMKSDAYHGNDNRNTDFMDAFWRERDEHDSITHSLASYAPKIKDFLGDENNFKV